MVKSNISNIRQLISMLAHGMTKLSQFRKIKMTNEKPQVTELTAKLTKQLTWLWAMMKAKYPTLWVERNGSSFSSDGEFTPIAKNWLGEMLNLSSQQIQIGFNTLSDRKNAAFPPTAVEFVSHCKEQGFQECADEIFDYINKEPDSDWWWKSEPAFNVYKQLYYNPLNNQGSDKVLANIERIYRKLDFKNLDPIPPKPIALPVKEPTKIQFDQRRFQGKMFFSIMKIRPDLMGKVVDRADGTKDAITDSKVKEIFTPHKTRYLMINYGKGGFENMTDFLRNEGFAL